MKGYFTDGGVGGVTELPIGSLYFSTVATNPATSLGYGTWGAYATGRVPVGIDISQVEFDTLGETGGEKTHILTSAEVP